MKKSIIKDILTGRGHREAMKIPKDNENNMRIICDIYDKLEEKLSPELLKSHQKLVDALEDNWCEEADNYFVEGFKLGLLIGIECMEE